MAASKKARAKSRATPKTPARRTPKARSPATPARSRAASKRSTSARRVSSRATPARDAQKLARETVAQMVPAEALGLLEQDHREAEAFFAQFEQDEERRPALARKICLALTIHATIEEEIFYPAARGAASGDLLDEAEVEHASAKQLIAEIEAMRPEDRLFAAKVKVLGEYVKHHIAEEEGQLFPMLRESGLDLLQLGMQLAERRIALLTELAPGLRRPQRRSEQRKSPQRRTAKAAAKQPRKPAGRTSTRRRA
jgi:hemerythrin superfamily protein